MERTPKKTNPSTTSAMLSIHMNALTGRLGNTAASTMDRPDVPPNAKWLGVLNSSMPSAVKNRPALSSAKNLSLSGRRSGASSRGPLP